MTTYAEDRARRIEAGPTGKAKYNGSYSRQVRRQRLRAEDNQELSSVMQGRLRNLEPGKGILFTRDSTAMGNFRRLIICPIGSRETPSADYTARYSALFKVLPSAELH